MEEKIIIAGFGGQGILFLGKLICQAGMEGGFNVTYFPSYGAEVRGGTANCHIVLSDKNIASPVVGRANTLIIMNEPSLLKFEPFLIPKGLLLFNSSLIKIQPKRNDIQIKSIPATDMAYKLGNAKTTNMIMLGGYIKTVGLLKRDFVVRNIKGELADLNIKAIDLGMMVEATPQPLKNVLK